MRRRPKSATSPSVRSRAASPAGGRRWSIYWKRALSLHAAPRRPANTVRCATSWTTSTASDKADKGADADRQGGLLKLDPIQLAYQFCHIHWRSSFLIQVRCPQRAARTEHGSGGQECVST